jgi:uncharacterized protein YdgA (DUF945 family)
MVAVILVVAVVAVTIGWYTRRFYERYERHKTLVRRQLQNAFPGLL